MKITDTVRIRVMVKLGVHFVLPFLPVRIFYVPCYRKSMHCVDLEKRVSSMCAPHHVNTVTNANPMNGSVLDLTIFGCSKMSNMITLSTLPVPEIDLSMTLKVIPPWVTTSPG